MTEIRKSQIDAREPLFFLSAGDPSGDAHAARLVEALERRLPNSRFLAFAGSKTAATNCDVRFDLTKFAVMMLTRAILNLRRYLGALKLADKIFDTERPDAVILVDFPGFNWKIAQKAKKRGIPVVYFMPPQIWGWGQWRVKKMRKYVDLILSCFAFEDDWFREQGCNSLLIGHPFFEESRSRSVDSAFISSLQSDRPNERILTLLPGSRDQEVANNLDSLINVAAKVQGATRNIRPIFAAFREEHANIIRERLAQRQFDYEIYVGKTPELMRAATCCLGVSGSVSIELLSLCKPTVILYRTTKLEYRALRFLKRVKYITLTNLLAVHRLPGESPFYPKGFLPKSTEHTQRERSLMVFPEFLDYRDRSDEAASVLTEWLQDDATLSHKIDELRELRTAVDVEDRPIERAADIIASNMFANAPLSSINVDSCK
ncbi:MAG: hypothetical protein IJU03_01805 [Thermoguttaceae bacterium]|nr:hypothetical protein [Thermoguttaceae bacterium]